MGVTKERRRSDMVFLYLKGRLDNTNAPSLEENIMRLIDEGARQLIVDCSQIEHINNAGLRMLLNIDRRILKTNGRIALHSLSQPAKDMFEKTGFSLISRIYENREEAAAGAVVSAVLTTPRRRRGTTSATKSTGSVRKGTSSVRKGTDPTKK